MGYQPYPRMLYCFVGTVDEANIIVNDEQAEDEARSHGFHHYTEPDPPEESDPTVPKEPKAKGKPGRKKKVQP